MFDTLSGKFEAVFHKLRNRGKITESDIDEALKEIRIALLDADVNVQVVRSFCDSVRKKSLGKEVMRTLNPEQTIVKFVFDELVSIMGKQEPLNLRCAPPAIVVLVGLQGSGKTTSAGKLALYIKNSLKRRPMLVSVDVYRPAAIEQLRLLGQQIGVDVHQSLANQSPIEIAKSAVTRASNAGHDVLIVDTAGRLQIDKDMMDELSEIVKQIKPNEILLVADAMTGQEAANVAKSFNELIELNGLILTKLDGDARGGAALSICSVTGKPVKFMGLGEKLEALEVFHPDRLASRILGMGDILTLIEKASKEITAQDINKLHTKIQKNEFSLDDFYKQLQTVKSLGSVGSLMKMIPGMNSLMKGVDESLIEYDLKRMEAIILSMTKKEKRDYQIIDGSRRRRIAKGSGTSVEDVNALLDNFSKMKKMMKGMSKGLPKGLKPEDLKGVNLKELAKRFSGGMGNIFH